MTPLRPTLLALGLAGVLAASASAQSFVVFDPTNYASNVLQAARALEQIEHQVQSLQNEAAMLAGQARNLTSLNLPAFQTLRGDMAQLNGLLTAAGRLAGDVQALRVQFDQQYGAPAGGADGRALAQAADARWLNSVESLRRTLQVQARIDADLTATTDQAARIADQSDAAVGSLQAAQAGNQLLAVQSKQLADLTALLSAQGQADALEAARAAASAADAKARLQRFLGQP